ncbi:hypothetical protein LTR86_008895 [Recurvomyces mirabilis]|nr:hypothetical protein LTR86_008895 [Recurvomyces mirabilis]
MASQLTHTLALSFLIAQVVGHDLQRRTSPLDQYPRNTIPNLGGPVLYYNGTGPVPGIDIISPLPVPLPNLTSYEAMNAVVQEMVAIGSGKLSTDTCSICTSSLEVLHIASLSLSQDVLSDIMIEVCQTLDLTSLVAPSTCSSYFSGIGGLGPYFSQLLRRMSAATGDMQAFCYYEFGLCRAPPITAVDENDWFHPKPVNKTAAPPPSGKTANVLHFSDWHMDPRFDIGSEANCTTGLCCRSDSKNAALHTNVTDPSLPASRFGDFLCDSPPDLALSAFADMRRTVDLSTVSFAIFTGDIVSHDQTDQESRALSTYEETIAYQTFKAQLGDVPVYSTLGNHDSWPSGFNTPNSFGNDSAPNTFSWNYDLLSSLWQQAGWIDGNEAQYAASHYGAYAHTTKDGLRVISINSDFWYTPNIFNYYNYANPDKSGILRFLTAELLAAEAKDQRAWIIGHVPSGGSSAIANPSALFHSIVARFSPATIAGVFFGHTHQDGKQLYYDFASNSTTANSSRVVRNYTSLDYNSPLAVAYIGPSIVPLTNYNAGWSMYEVDAETFSVVNGQVHFANISNSLTWSPAPVWEFEYDIRQTYDPNCTWPTTAPLNETFWNQVTKNMLNDSALIEQYLFLATKSSVKTAACLGVCLQKSICGIRSSNRAVYELCNA